VAELVSVTDGTARFTLQFFADRNWAPAPGSPATRERSCDFRGPHGRWGHEPIETAQSWIGLLVIAATDHLGSLATLSGPGSAAVFGGTGIARLAVEAAARASWLLEPSLDVFGRVQRGYALRLAGLRHAVGVLTKMRAPETAIAEREQQVEKVLRRADRLGIPVHRRDGAPTGLVLGPPTNESLVAELFGSVGIQQGAGIYAFLSSVVHSHPWALLQFADTTSPREDGLIGLQPRLTLADLEHSVMVAVASHVGLCDRLFPYYGFDSELWASWRVHALRAVLRR